MENSYLRIGTEFYKVVNKPGIHEEFNKEIIKWKRQTIVDDHGKDFLSDIDKYDGFTVIPSHENYKQEHGDFYNQYHKLSHHQKEYSLGNTYYTWRFLKHIFGDQLRIGVDYLSILWHHPTHVLPILCLVSDERNTGKTSFLNWLKLIFESNVILNKNSDLRSRFNSDWTNKLIVAVDEVLLDKKQDAESLKNLSTAKNTTEEGKGVNRKEVQFFGKFVLCSNNEKDFILIDEKEIRYWVRKIPEIINPIPDLPDKLEAEIPYFISFLSNRKISTKKVSRMWFSKHDIHTSALDKLIKGTKLSFEKELILLLEDLMGEFELDYIDLTLGDITNYLSNNKVKINRTLFNKTVREKWGLTVRNSSYKFYYKTKIPNSKKWIVEYETRIGRYYRFTKELLNQV